MRHRKPRCPEADPFGDDLERGHSGLVRVTDGAIAVMPGIHSGDVAVTVANGNIVPALA
ncbi:hypothetical protein OG866_44450 [Streptomyces sp. NBC_00663]|uniref:hypothetical protein n=1 Tax=Streptomyces sp. NBC_00663 TaxID=2975801 RepID=UPI002E2FAA6B|nr:hypothetical protein [Streptomyces sp. NBC_00663]